MSERARVVILNPDPREGEAWEHALAASCDLRRCSEAHTLALLLEERPADVVVAPCDAAILEAVQRVRGHAGLVLCGAILPEGVIDAAGEGTDLRHVATPERLRRAVLALARPRSPMVRKRIPGLTLLQRESPPAEVLDLSNRGFSFRLELDQQLESFLPGAQLPPLSILRGEKTLLESATAHVRYVEQAHDSDGRSFYRIGCELPLRISGDKSQIRGSRIDDAATCVGLLRVALRQGGIFLQPTEDESDGFLFESGHIDLEERTLRLDGGQPSFETFEVVRGSFEVGASSYKFLSSVISAEPLVLRLPAVIEAAHRRSAARHRPDASRPIFVKLATPLWGERDLPERPVLEISATGFSFAIDPTDDLFPPGLRLNKIQVTLGELDVRCQGEVRNLAPLHGNSTALRCGVVFTELSSDDRGRLADALMRHRFPGLADGAEFPFDELWSFLEETRFIYPKKMEALAPLLPAVRETFGRLQQGSGSIFKAVVFHEDRRLYAHISAVRSHSRSFVLQHLAGATRIQARQATRVVNLGISEYLAQDQHLDYGKSFFRPENKWPARVFGGYARKINDRQRSDLRMFDYQLYPTDPRLPETSEIRVIEARGADLAVIEQHYVSVERGLILRSDDLTRGTLELRAVDESYGAAGLFRRRHVLLALHHDEPVGFALCEVSSPGLNLSELLSALRIVVLPLGKAMADGGASVRTALMREAMPLYRRAERSTVPLLKATSEPDPVAGFEPVERKVYVCWTWHRSILPTFSEHVERMYKRLEATLADRGRRSLETPFAGVQAVDRPLRKIEAPPVNLPVEKVAGKAPLLFATEPPKIEPQIEPGQ